MTDGADGVRRRTPSGRADPFAVGTTPGGVPDGDRGGDGGPAREGPPRARRRDAALLAGVLLGAGRALANVYEAPPPREDAVVWEADDDEPDPDRPLWVDFDPVDPHATVVHVRRPA